MPDNSSFWNNLVSGLQTMMGRGNPAYSTQQKPAGVNEAYASFYPTYEVTTPQYQTPNSYQLAQVGFRENELAYACINERAISTAEAGIMVKRITGETPEELPEHPMTKFMREPCPGYVTQQEFWTITELYLNVAGVCYWEKERNNRGEVIALWPMRPDWCSTYRGEGQPLRAIRYQPYGLPPLDIPIDDVVTFQYFDPLWPLLKGYSPTAAALKMITTDTSMTDMVNAFIHNGAFLGGNLSTEQALTEAEAERARARFRQLHGGSENAGDILVTGKGIKFVSTNNTFREMVFPEVDARSESRICMAYRVSPLLIAAKVGIGVATYNNYAEARKAQAERVTIPEWRFLAGNLWQQLLPDFEPDYKKFEVEFDLRQVRVLQEDRTAKWTRAQTAAASNLVTRDEAREEMGLDPVDHAPVFVGNGGAKTLEDQMNPPEPVVVPGKLPAKPAAAEQDDANEAAQEAEKFHTFAKHRIKEGKVGDIPQYEFKHVSPERAVALVAMYSAPAIFAQMDKAIKLAESETK